MPKKVRIKGAWAYVVLHWRVRVEVDPFVAALGLADRTAYENCKLASDDSEVAKCVRRGHLHRLCHWMDLPNAHMFVSGG